MTLLNVIGNIELNTCNLLLTFRRAVQPESRAGIPHAERQPRPRARRRSQVDEEDRHLPAEVSVNAQDLAQAEIQRDYLPV